MAFVPLIPSPQGASKRSGGGVRFEERRARSMLAVVLVAAVVSSLIQRFPAADTARLMVTALVRPALELVLPVRRAVTAAFAMTPERSERAVAAADLAVRATIAERRAAEMERQVVELRKLMKMGEPFRSRGIPAAVLTNPSLTGGRTMILDRGADHGIRQGSIVLSPAVNATAVVGRVESVTEKVSRVKTVIDPSLQISARLTGSGGYVYAGPHQGGLGRLEYVPHDRRVAVGEPIYTSSDGTLFPDGLLIGTVVSVRRGGSIFHEILVEPAVDMGRAHYVWAVGAAEEEGK